MRQHLQPAIRTLVVFVFLSVALSASADPKTPEIDAIFADLDSTSSPGCSVAVFRDDQLIFEKGYGMASLELGVPNSPETVFYIGSTSKQFVAASIVIAAREGHLSLDDDIRKFMTELPTTGRRSPSVT